MEEEILKNINTKIIGRKIIILKEIDSTQNYIKSISKNENLNGTVAIAKNQVKGIGTNGKVWYTEKDKNLTFSIYLTPNCNVKNIENLTIIIAEVIVQVIEKLFGYHLDIKYPNDIMIYGKKTGGILTEAIINKENVKELIIGIGLNINQENFDEEIKFQATSLKKEFKKDFNKYEILVEFLNEFEKKYMTIL